MFVLTGFRMKKRTALPPGVSVMDFSTLKWMFEILENDVAALSKNNVNLLIHRKIARINLWIMDNWRIKPDNSKIPIEVQRLYDEVVSSLNANKR